MYCVLCELLNTKTSVFAFAFCVSQCFSYGLCEKKSIIWGVLVGVQQNLPTKQCRHPCLDQYTRNPMKKLHTHNARTERLSVLLLQIYTDWANHYLAKSGCQRLIKDLSQDVTDGVLLAQIIQIIGMNPHGEVNPPHSAIISMKLISATESLTSVIKTKYCLALGITKYLKWDINDVWINRAMCYQQY